MAEKTFSQDFKGYRLESNISSLSTKSGVYGVYRCIYRKASDKVSLVELLYLGKADDLKDRISTHEKWDEWRKELKVGEQICFCYSFINKLENERVEATLINSNKPRLNIEYKYAFPFDRTLVNCSGKHAKIKNSNIVSRH